MKLERGMDRGKHLCLMETSMMESTTVDSDMAEYVTSAAMSM